MRKRDEEKKRSREVGTDGEREKRAHSLTRKEEETGKERDERWRTGRCVLEEGGGPREEPSVGITIEPKPIGRSKTRRSNPLNIQGRLY